MFKKLFSIFRRNKYIADDIMCRATRTKATDSYMNKLIKDDNNVSVGNFFLVACTIVGLLLLLVPLFVLTIEAWFNHTITTDLGGMASYIVAVCSIFTVGGLTHGWTSWSKSKFENINKDKDGDQMIDDEDLSSDLVDEEEV